jgi:DNA-directed RNA polymerase specialized sigma24 family protein
MIPGGPHTAWVDLKGQLSNPGEKLETLGLQGSRASRRRRVGPDLASEEVDSGSKDGTSEEKGQHSNPVSPRPARQAQRRLKPAEIDELLTAYLAGDLIRDIAARFGVSRTTVIGHVTRQGLPHRRDADWTPPELAKAADLYAAGHSLAQVGQHLGVDKSTVANRFRRAGLPVRRRRGWS